jgi:hypothetical protein
MASFHRANAVVTGKWRLEIPWLLNHGTIFRLAIGGSENVEQDRLCSLDFACSQHGFFGHAGGPNDRHVK